MKCISPVWVRSQMMHVPCGKCAFCVRKAINAWCTRLRHELEASSSAFFLTLTYDNENLPADGELNKRDLQLFIKRLRKANPGIRYFAVGEYGTQGERPHYHAVIFNLLDLSLVTDNWKLGFVKGSRANAGRIRYMVSYMALPQDVSHRQAPFRLMSRRPGIGSAYLEKMGEFHRARCDPVIYDFGTANAMPRFYKDKLYTKAQKRFMQIRAMKYSEQFDQVVCPVEHDRLWKKLNRKNK